MTLIMVVGIGGFIGSILRYSLSFLFKSSGILGMPLNTLFINISGSFLIGLLLVLGHEKLGENWFYFLVPGLLGGFTTYSAFSAETVHLIKNQNWGAAILYITLTVAGGILATFLGYLLSKYLIQR